MANTAEEDDISVISKLDDIFTVWTQFYSLTEGKKRQRRNTFGGEGHDVF